ncbi:Hexokinase [Yarrowia sp. C11]|nr:Hexokinase [Yarrowia sp. E02]KAG5372415.1 Hexokinase [Yarrowia sp. C11]
MVHLGPRKPPSRKGSMADVPRDLLEQISQLETIFTVSPEKLRQITDHFVAELAKGLTKEGGDIPMNPTWILDWPTGKESGCYLALDMGGTNLRVVKVTLDGERGFDVMQSKYHMPPNIKVGKQEELWEYIAECLGKFLADNYPEALEAHNRGRDVDRTASQSFTRDKSPAPHNQHISCSPGFDIHKIPLGFTFSYPCSQPAVNRGVLQRWTKGFDIEGVEGEDVVPMLEAALERKNIPISITALINDTTGTCVASNYHDPQIKLGNIFGTGVNAAYYEKVKDIPKLKGLIPDSIDPETPMAVNCEYGAFDNEHKVLPRTKWDIIIDEESPRPGQQTFEKMSAGYYLGELLRLVLLDLYNDGFVFEHQGKNGKELGNGNINKSYFFDTSFLSLIEEDPWENLTDVEILFKEKLGITTTEPERKLIRRLAELIGTRSARISACGVAAICKKAGYKEAHAGADGSVFNKYPGFKQRGAQALNEIFEWNLPNPKDHPIKIVPAEDGSGVGAALCAALTIKRVKQGLPVGVKPGVKYDI